MSLLPRASDEELRRRVRAMTMPRNEPLARSLNIAGIVRLVLPSPPSSREAWRLMKGRIVTSAAQHAYKVNVASACAQQVAQDVPTAAPITIEIDWYRPRRSGDLDNRAKVVLDALQGLVYVNDSQIIELHMRRFDDKVRPRLVVTIQMVDER